jgi:hypothetical protein
MEFEPQDQDIVSLLAKLKNAEGQYPEHMLVARRHMFLKQMAEVGMGISPDPGNPGASAPPSPPPVAPVTGTLLETALVFAIIVEASAVAYFYRDQLSDFFETITITTEPRVQVGSPLPVIATAVEIDGVTPSPAIPSTVPSSTLAPSIVPSTVGVTATLPIIELPPVAGEDSTNSQPGGAGVIASPAPTDSPVESTPVPGGSGSGNDRDDQGNHYGQTPKPERTIEPGNDRSNGNSNGNGNFEGPRDHNNGNNGNNRERGPAENPRPTGEE